MACRSPGSGRRQQRAPGRRRHRQALRAEPGRARLPEVNAKRRLLEQGHGFALGLLAWPGGPQQGLVESASPGDGPGRTCAGKSVRSPGGGRRPLARVRPGAGCLRALPPRVRGGQKLPRAPRLAPRVRAGAYRRVAAVGKSPVRAVEFTLKLLYAWKQKPKRSSRIPGATMQYKGRVITC